MIAADLTLFSSAAPGLFVQSCIVSTVGTAAFFLIRKRSAPVRSSFCLVSLYALLALPIVSSAFMCSRVSILSLFPQGKKHVHHLAAPHGPQVNDANAMGMNVRSNPLPAQDGIHMHQRRFMPANTLDTWIKAGALIWVFGIAAFIARIILGLYQLSRLRSSFIPVSEERAIRVLRQEGDEFPCQSPTQLYTSTAISSPQCIGFVHPRIVIPARIYDGISEKQLRCICAHELAHIYHRDNILGLLQRVVQALYWWNPLVAWINRDLSIAREEVCDTSSIFRLQNPRDYAECLMGIIEKCTAGKMLPAAICMASAHLPIETRITSILSKERNMATRVNPSTVAGHCVLIFAITLIACGLQVPQKEEISYTPMHVGDVHQLVFNDSTTIQTDTIVGKTRRADGVEIFHYRTHVTRSGIGDSVSNDYFFTKNGYYTSTTVDSFSDTNYFLLSNPLGEQRLFPQRPFDNASWQYSYKAKSGDTHTVFFRCNLYGKTVAMGMDFDSVFSVVLGDSISVHNENHFVTTLWAQGIGMLKAILNTNPPEEFAKLTYAKINKVEYGTFISK